MKKVLAILLVSVLLLSLIAACGDTTTDNGGQPATTPAPGTADTPTPSTPDTPSGPVYDGKDNLRISDSPVTVTLFSAHFEILAPEGDMMIWQEAAGITGVQMENIANPAIADRDEALSMMILQGNLPDIIYERAMMLLPIIEDGGLIPLQDLIAEHAPNLQAYFDSVPAARIAATHADGNIYFIPLTLSSSRGTVGEGVPTQAWFVREDWLDELNMSFPETFDEFEAMLYAFRDNFDNAIPYFYRDGSPLGLYQLFGVQGDWAVQAIDYATDTVIYSRVEEDYKNALRGVAKWYADGLIDPRLFDPVSAARQEYLANNTGGSTFDWHISTAAVNYDEDILAANPGMRFMPMLPPYNVHGRRSTEYAAGAITLGETWGISRDAADPVTVIKFMDFWFSDVGIELFRYGIEGYTWNERDPVTGLPILNEYAHTAEGGSINLLRRMGATGSVAGAFGIDLSARTEIAQQTFRMYQQYGNLIEPFPMLQFTPEEQEVVSRVQPQLWTLALEYEQQVIMGSRNVDETWAGYIAEMEALGLREYLAAMNAAYDRFKEIRDRG